MAKSKKDGGTIMPADGRIYIKICLICEQYILKPKESQLQHSGNE